MMTSQKDDLIAKVTDLIKTNFAGSWTLAWEFYDVNRDNKVSREELMALLTRAKIGNKMTRPLWCSEIAKELDKDGDGFIGRDEFLDVFRE